jgi:hypothetical protein
VTLQELLNKLDIKEKSDSEFEIINSKIKFYYASASSDEHIKPGDALRSLIEYFGNPKKQENDVYKGDDGNLAGDPVFEELRTVQNYLGKREDHWFGREGLVIIEDQLAFMKKEGDLVQLAIYMPFNDTPGDEASINIYEFNIKDFS